MLENLWIACCREIKLLAFFTCGRFHRLKLSVLSEPILCVFKLSTYTLEQYLLQNGLCYVRLYIRVQWKVSSFEFSHSEPLHTEVNVCGWMGVEHSPGSVCADMDGFLVWMSVFLLSIVG